jgi:hypothetical protein
VFPPFRVWNLISSLTKGRANIIRVVECKSYLDSRGVGLSAFDGRDSKGGSRFKLLLRDDWRSVVEQQLLLELQGKGLTEKSPQITWCLAAGKVKGTDEPALERWFSERGWQFWGPGWIAEHARALAKTKYENDVATIMSKIILRDRAATKKQATQTKLPVGR